MVITSNPFSYVLHLLLILCNICVHMLKDSKFCQDLIAIDSSEEEKWQCFGSLVSEIVGRAPRLICYRDPWKAKIFLLYINMPQAEVQSLCCVLAPPDIWICIRPMRGTRPEIIFDSQNQAKSEWIVNFKENLEQHFT